MILYFKVTNFKSIKETEISFISSNSLNTHLDHIYHLNKFNINKFGVLFGPNGSGKSNLIKALSTLKDIVLNKNVDEEYQYSFNKNDLNNKDLDSIFNIIFSLEDKIYEYKLTLNFFNLKLIKEELNEIKDDIYNIYSVNNEIKLDNYEAYKFFKEHLIIYSARYNVIKTNLFNKKEINKLLTYLNLFQTKIIDINLVNSSKKEVKNYLPPYFYKTLDKMINRLNKDETLSINIGFNFFLIHNKKVKKITNKHAKLNYFIEYQEESDGISRLFSLCLMLFNIKKDNVILIDEIDKSLHQKLSILVTKYFINEVSKLNSQLIFSSHNTLLLDKEYFKEDEIYFLEKSKLENSKLYSLIDFELDNNEYLKNYQEGRYGAIPK